VRLSFVEDRMGSCPAWGPLLGIAPEIRNSAEFEFPLPKGEIPPVPRVFEHFQTRQT